MSGGSNSADKIAELRRERQAALGKAKRAAARATELRGVAWREDDRAARLAREIESMGGKVRR